MASASAYNKLSTAYASYSKLRRDTSKELSTRIADIKRKIKEDEERFKELQLMAVAGVALASVASARAERSKDYVAGLENIGAGDEAKLSILDKLGITSAVPKNNTIINDIRLTGDIVREGAPSSMRMASIQPVYSVNTGLVRSYGRALRQNNPLSSILREQVFRTANPLDQYK